MTPSDVEQHPIRVPVPETTHAACDPGAIEVECDQLVLDGIRDESVEGLKKLAKGGVEIGGVLFGLRSSTGTRVLAYRSLACEHRFGPSFILSDKDEQLLHAMLDTAHDEKLRGLEPVGWYVSHCRQGFTLTDRDTVLFDSHFMHPGDVAIVLMPEKTRRARAGFFVRRADGDLKTDGCSRELVLPGVVEVALAAKPAESAARAIVPAPAVQAEVYSNPERELANPRLQNFLKQQERHRRISAWNLSASVALLVFGLSLGGYLWLKSRVHTLPPVALHVTGSGQQIRIAWDPSLDAVRTATSGVLEIRDGTANPVTVPVTNDALETGSAVYNKQSENVEVRLRLLYPNRPAAESVVYFIDPAKSQPVTVIANVLAPPAAPPAVVEQPQSRDRVREDIPVHHDPPPPRAFKLPSSAPHTSARTIAAVPTLSPAPMAIAGSTLTTSTLPLTSPNVPAPPS